MVTITRQALALCKCGTSGQGQELCGVDLTNSEAIRSETPIKNQTLPKRVGGVNPSSSILAKFTGSSNLVTPKNGFWTPQY